MRGTRRLASTVLMSIALFLGGCGSDDPADTKSSPTPPSGSTTGSSSPSDSPSPSITPASGPVIDQKSATLHAPAGWKIDPPDLPFTIGAQDQQVPGIQSVTVIDFKSTSAFAPSLATQARIAMKGFRGAQLKRLPDVMLDGAPAYHLAGLDTGKVPYEEIGTHSHNRSIGITFNLATTPSKERREIVDSVIASFQWKK